MRQILGLAVALGLYVFWGGYVAFTLWGWFVVPLGVKAITYWHAVGLGCAFAAFAGVKIGSGTEKPYEQKEAEALFFAAATPAALLAVGWFASINMSVA